MILNDHILFKLGFERTDYQTRTCQQTQYHNGSKFSLVIIGGWYGWVINHIIEGSIDTYEDLRGKYFKVTGEQLPELSEDELKPPPYSRTISLNLK